MTEYKVKNIIDALEQGEVDIILQGCNCFCGFGRGLALEIKNRYPEAYKVDKETAYGDKGKLGTITYAEVLTQRFIVNCYTQFHWIKPLNKEKEIIKNGRKDYLLADYRAIRMAFVNLRKEFDNSWSLGLPKIGAGWANGDWDVIEQIVKDELIDKGYDVTFYVIDEKEIPKR